MSSRLNIIYSDLERQGLDGLFLSSSANITYLTGYLSPDSYLLVSHKGNIYITDSRYSEEARAELKGMAAIKKINGSLFKTIALACRELGLKRVGFEERCLPFAEYQKIKEYLRRNTSLIPTHSLVEVRRQVKDKDELKKIRHAVKITLKAFEFVRSFIKPGIREVEIAAELERFIRYNGASASAFDIIVASGSN
ncbi:MAG: aminopeptidase P family N-terminal domain-containing protein, partial [Candidatus Omnitrophica bacterium]|nr:aminopeptidase P family N-terminal domain-containing protein [Candidatus Omnitrophota bacterium]